MSLSFSPPHPHPALLARLHMYAVLPAFSDLMKHSPQARALLDGQNMVIAIQASAIMAALEFSAKHCHFHYTPPAKPTVTLRFLGYRQLNRQFSGSGFSLPIPTRGGHRIRAMKTFAALSKVLLYALLPDKSHGTTRSPADRDLYVRLTLGVGLAAACELIRHEEYSSSLFASCGDFIIGLHVEDFDLRAWLGVINGVPQWGRGDPNGTPTASVSFKNPSVALKALSGRFDNLAAVTTGAITIKGMIPLIDKMNAVFERVPVYLEPKQTSHPTTA